MKMDDGEFGKILESGEMADKKREISALRDLLHSIKKGKRSIERYRGTQHIGVLL